MGKFQLFKIIVIVILCLLIKTESITFNEEFNSKNDIPLETSEHHIQKRFMMASAGNVPNKNYQACITPSGTKGHCKHVHNCVMAEFKNNFLKVFDYLCVIERSSIGVCCPDNFAEKQGSRFSGALPMHGDEYLVGEESGRIINRGEDRGCGLATKQFPKISGGRPAEPDEWPWMAAILRPGVSNAFCGGVLITDRHVLTASHCIYKYSATDIYVRLGEYDFKAFNETRSRDFRVLEIRQHVDFDSTTYENDIAILKLDRPTIFNTYIWPVCMPPLSETWEDYIAVVTGWGTQSFGGPHSNVLMEVTVPIWEQEKCKESFVQRISDNFMCAGAEEGGRDSCQGDSGGPLLIQLPNNRWVVVGIVSWGLRCGEENHPGIYTRVNQYTSWVIENSVY